MSQGGFPFMNQDFLNLFNQSYNPGLQAALQNIEPLGKGEIDENIENYEPRTKHAKMEGDGDHDSGIAHTPSPHNLSDDVDGQELQIAEEEDEEEGENEEESLGEFEKPPLSPQSGASEPHENSENEPPPTLSMAPYVPPAALSNLFPGRVWNQICVNAYFHSFEDFERVFEHWKNTKFHPFRVASSEKMVESPLGDTFKYRYIVYHCKHYGKPRMRGQGKRPNQNYLPCGCGAMLRLNYQAQEKALRLTTLIDEHNGHEVSKDAYLRALASSRKSNATPRGSPRNNYRAESPSMFNPQMNLGFMSPPVPAALSAQAYQQQSIAALLLMQQQQNFQRQLQELASANLAQMQQQQIKLETPLAAQNLTLPTQAPPLVSGSQDVPTSSPVDLAVKTELPQESTETPPTSQSQSLLPQSQTPLFDSPQLPTPLARPTPTRPPPQGVLLPPFAENFGSVSGFAMINAVMQALAGERQRRLDAVLEGLRSHLQAVGESDHNAFCSILQQLEAIVPKK
ncbi:hypothetical protein L596_024192 [Steinernema carpocapsae]|uniref:ZSWIM3 N-terminal domain-containing protein n=1 Tax=Steinernema carpocapsae TaxID=34508 RepID=A0A4U5MG09_STECR|nr:hypothetical protein L596_024192 [Steinernema carpocapsae]